jgi:large subunit ribosomal protein L25
MLTLDVQVRNKEEALSSLRKEGKMPAVFYGKIVAATPISLSQKEFIKIWRLAGESSVVTLKDKTASVDTLIHAVDVDPVTDIPRHADFYVFEKGKKMEISVPIEFEGVAPVVKDLGGILVKALHELKISADPQHIPHDIKVDISTLIDFDSQILAEQITLPNGVTLMENPTEVVAAASRPKEEEVEEAPVDLSSIEVEKKGKKEEEEGASEGETKE